MKKSHYITIAGFGLGVFIAGLVCFRAPTTITDIFSSTQSVSVGKTILNSGLPKSSHPAVREQKTLEQLFSDFATLSAESNLEDNQRMRVEYMRKMLAAVSSENFFGLLDFFEAECSDLELALVSSEIVDKGNSFQKDFAGFFLTKIASRKFDNLIGQYVRELGRSDPLAIASFLQTIPPGHPVRNNLVAYSIQRLIEVRQNGEALTLLEQTPGIQIPPQTLLEVAKLGVHNRNGLDLVKDFSKLNSKIPGQIAFAVFHEQAATDLNFAKEMLDKLSSTNLELANDAVRGLVSQWMTYSSKAPTEWFNQLEKGPVRDSGINEFCTRLASSDPESASLWVTAITDPNMRASTAFQLYSNWRTIDAANANTWAFEHFPDLIKNNK